MKEKEMDPMFLDKVFGYANVKEELYRIYNWLTDKTLQENEKLSLPRGILFYGAPGCGKTLLMREYAHYFKSPIYIVEGNNEDSSSKEISDCFAKARKEKFAIIIIDEIDHLIDNNPTCLRTLKTELDGFNRNGHLLVLVGTNDKRVLPESLLRSGRFDRSFHIGYPKRNEREELLSYFLQEVGAETPSIDIKTASNYLDDVSGADIRSIVNDAYLRSGSSLTCKDLLDSYDRIVEETYNNPKANMKDRRIAIHEAGHAVMALRFHSDFDFYKSSFTDKGGITIANLKEEDEGKLSTTLETIMIGFGGISAERLFYGNHDLGVESDISNIKSKCVRLVQTLGYKGDWRYISKNPSNDYHLESQTLRRSDEKAVIRLFKSLQRKTYRLIKKDKELISKIADIMMDKGEASYLDVKSLDEVKSTPTKRRIGNVKDKNYLIPSVTESNNS